jgi:hypothetical protein
MTGNPEEDPLVLELLEWVSAAERTYPEAIEAWGSRCPRHTPWENAIAADLIRVESRGAADRAVVVLTDRGAAALRLS